MNRVIVIGIQGSGKSTFANNLGRALEREVIHLDKLYYKPGWQAVTKPEWLKIMEEIVSKDQGIIDGNYHSTLDKRLKWADTIIFLNYSKWLCIYRALKRSIKKEQPFDKALGNNEKITWDLIHKILRYPRKEVLTKLHELHKSKQVYIINNSSEAEELIHTLSSISRRK